MKDKVQLGHFTKPQGLQGGIWLFSQAGPELLQALLRVWIEGAGEFAIEALTPGSGQHLVFLRGVHDRSVVEAWSGKAVWAFREDLPSLEAGSYYYFELIGLPVWVAGQKLGQVEDLEDTGTQDLLVINHSGRQSLVPLQAPYVWVEPDGIHLEPIPGLME